MQVHDPHIHHRPEEVEKSYGPVCIPSPDSSGARVTVDLRWHDHAGRAHRIGGPAVVKGNGMTLWYVHGVLHRDGGPAVVIPVQPRGLGGPGSALWYRDGLLVSTLTF